MSAHLDRRQFLAGAATITTATAGVAALATSPFAAAASADPAIPIAEERLKLDHTPFEDMTEEERDSVCAKQGELMDRLCCRRRPPPLTACALS